MIVMGYRLMVVSCCLLVAGTSLCSCSSDDETMVQENSDGRKVRQLTIANASLTRAVIDGETLKASWAITDRPVYLNLSALPSNVYYDSLMPSTAGETTTLTGNVTCSEGDDIAIIFPAVTPQQPSGNPAYFTINLSGQKGTLADIGTNYHYVWGVAHEISVSDNTATGTVNEMKSLLSLCKFTFVHNESPVNVHSVQIGWGANGAAGYPQTGRVEVELENIENVYVEPDTPNGPLSITPDQARPDGVIYVALFPCDRSTFHFTVSDGTNTYTGTKSAKMLAGKYYEVSIEVN